MITYPADAIEQLGGPMAVTRQLGLPYTTVHSWWFRQSIPVPMWPRLVAVAAELGVKGLTYDALVQAHAIKKPRRRKRAA